MNNKDVSSALTRRFQKIRTTIEKMQDNTIKIICRTADETANNTRKYNAEYLREQQKELNALATDKIVALKEDTTQLVDGEFTAIRATLRDWISKPMPEEFTAVLSAFTQYGVQPTRMELETLEELGHGNYCCGRIVSQMARSLGFDSDFKPYESYLRDLSIAQRDTHSAIMNYQGLMDENYRYVSDMMGLKLAANPMFAPIAEKFLESSDNSFANIETELTTVTQTKFDLLPSKRRSIDELFTDTTGDDQRRAIVRRFIEDNDFTMCDLLRVYDPDLYQSSLSELSDARRAEAETAIRLRQEASRSVSEALRSVSEIDAIQRTTA